MAARTGFKPATLRTVGSELTPNLPLSHHSPQDGLSIKSSSSSSSCTDRTGGKTTTIRYKVVSCHIHKAMHTGLSLSCGNPIKAYHIIHLMMLMKMMEVVIRTMMFIFMSVLQEASAQVGANC